MEEYRLGELFEIKYLDRRRAWMKEIDYFYDYNEKQISVPLFNLLF